MGRWISGLDSACDAVLSCALAAAPPNFALGDEHTARLRPMHTGSLTFVAKFRPVDLI
jgi:hypothetical protein